MGEGNLKEKIKIGQYIRTTDGIILHIAGFPHMILTIEVIKKNMLAKYGETVGDVLEAKDLVNNKEVSSTDSKVVTFVDGTSLSVSDIKIEDIITHNGGQL